MVILGALMGCLGLLAILLKKTLLGTLVGLHFLFTGATMIFIISGALKEGRPADAQIFGMAIILASVAQLVGGLALGIRMFYLKGSVSLDEMRSLKQ